MTERGEYVQGAWGGHFQYFYSLVDHKGTIPSGNYIILVDPSWNNSASQHPDYKKVLIDIYCPEQVMINTIPNDRGVPLVEQIMRTFALDHSKT
jgi:hypothetical protein